MGTFCPGIFNSIGGLLRIECTALEFYYTVGNGELENDSNRVESAKKKTTLEGSDPQWQ